MHLVGDQCGARAALKLFERAQRLKHIRVNPDNHYPNMSPTERDKIEKEKKTRQRIRRLRLSGRTPNDIVFITGEPMNTVLEIVKELARE